LVRVDSNGEGRILPNYSSMHRDELRKMMYATWRNKFGQLD